MLIAFCLGHQHGPYEYGLLCLLGLCENALYVIPSGFNSIRELSVGNLYLLVQMYVLVRKFR